VYGYNENHKEFDEMLRFMRRINWTMVLVCGFVLAAMGGSFALAAAAVPKEKAYMDEVYMNMADVKNLHYTVDLEADTPMGQMKMTGDGDLKTEPVVYQNNMNIWFRDEKGKEVTVPLKQYAEENAGNFTVYTLQKNEWVKQTVAVGQTFSKQLSSSDKSALQKMMTGLMKDVKLQRETPTYKYMEVTLDSARLSDILDAAIKENKEKTTAVPNSMMAQSTAMARMLILSAGDITYVAKVDKKSKMITQVDMDMTGPIRKGASLFLDIAQPREKDQVKDFLAKSTMTMSVVYSKCNQIDSIVIPQEIKDTAKEYKPMTRVKRKHEVKTPVVEDEPAAI
jgi:hypothetical protein